MAEAIRVFVRYDMPDENKETRRDRHAKFNQPPPPQPNPPIKHVWDWFWELSSRRHENRPLSFTEMAHWSTLLYRTPTPFEITCLMRMDDAWIKETRKELDLYRDRMSTKKDKRYG